jgi:aspartate 1-decarboxylase
VQVHGNTLDLSNVPLGQNVTILEIGNSSALQSYTITLPASFGAIILAPALAFGLAVAIVVLSLLQKRRKR